MCFLPLLAASANTLAASLAYWVPNAHPDPAENVLTGDWGPGSCATALAPFSTTPFACAAPLAAECTLFTANATGTALSLYL